MDSFFFCFDVFVSYCFSLLSAFLYSEPFWNNQMHCKVTDCYFNMFCWNTTEKRKLEKSFLGTRVWASKPVYWSPKLAKCVTACRHNWHQLLKSWDPESVQMQFDIEPELDKTNLEINIEPPENCSATITTSNTSEKPPLLHIIINNKLLI